MEKKAAKILMVEGDRETREMLSNSLKTQNFDLIEAGSRAEAISRARKDKPDLIVLSLGWANLDGEKICRDLKEHKATSGIPLLVITPEDEHDVFFLSLGAEAAIGNFPGPNRLIGHCYSLLHRFDQLERIFLGKMCIDRGTRTVHFGKREWSQFTPKEFDLLYYLADHAGKAIHQSKLYEEIWQTKLPEGAEEMLRTVDTHILRLRKILEKELGVRGWIENKKKIGFRIKAP